MARRKSLDSPPDKPGRFVKGYEDDGSSFEHVNVAIEDGNLRRFADELRQATAEVEALKAEINAIKLKMDDPKRRADRLLRAITTGVLQDNRRVWKFADDEKGTMNLYDHTTYDLLEQREIESWERQEEITFEEYD